MEPRIVEYFQSMSRELILFIGADMIIRALSERYLAPEDQMTVNMLKVLKAAGAKLLILEPAIDEIWGHLKGTDHEFRAEFADMERYIDWAIASQSPKILIRAYFYNKLDPLCQVRPPAGWRSFIDNICSYRDLHTPHGRQQILLYCVDHFRMEPVSQDELDKLIDKVELSDLATRFESLKESRLLALNDASHVLAVYGKRDVANEYHRNNPLGFRTWWLTQEVRILSLTKEFIRRKGPYMMRPEFLINFIMFTPGVKQVAETFSDIMPSLLGIRLTNRMRPEILRDALQKARDYLDKDDARVRVEMGKLASRIKQGKPGAFDQRLAAPFDHDQF